MAESDDFDFALEDHISGEVGERVRAIISAAESAASVIRHEAEQQAQSRKRLAESERSRYLEAARQEADALLRDRVQRMSDLSDALIEGAERLLSEMSDANELRRQLDRMVGALAQSAEELAGESRAFRAAAPRQAPATPEPAATEPEPEPVAAEPVIPEPVAAEPQAEEPPLADVETVDEQPAAAGDDATAERRLRAAPDPADAVPNGGGATADREQDDDTLAARLVALQMAVAGSPRGEVEEHLRVTFALDDTTSILNDVFGAEAPRFAR